MPKQKTKRDVSDPARAEKKSNPTDLVPSRIVVARDVRAYVNGLAARSSTTSRITSAEMYGLILWSVKQFCELRGVQNYADFLRAMSIDPPTQ